jgi:hypothetical protein
VSVAPLTGVKLRFRRPDPSILVEKHADRPQPVPPEHVEKVRESARVSIDISCGRDGDDALLVRAVRTR